MKKTLIILLAMVAMAACKKDDPVKPAKEFDYTKTIIIRGETSKGYVPGLTPLEIVEQAEGMRWKMTYNDHNDDVYSPPIETSMGLGKEKDYSIPAIVLGVDFIVNPDVGYHKMFSHGFDVAITDINNDTIALIPNAVMLNARTLIEAAWAKRDFEEMYRIFEQEYKFVAVE